MASTPVVGALLLFSPLCSAFDATLNRDDGLFQLEEESDVLVSTRYIGWTAGWKWDGPKVKRGTLHNSRQSYQLSFRKQHVSSTALVGREDDHLTYDYQFTFGKSIAKTIGGGLQFNLQTSSPRLRGKSKPPQLIDNNRGWSWELTPGKRIEVRFSSRIAALYFEKGKRSRIRALFFRDELSPGTQQISMQVSFPDGSKVVDFLRTHAQSEKVKSGLPWLKDALPPTQSFIDLSYLNHKPAGKFGFVKVDGERLVFENGMQARFFGVNIQANSLFIKDKALIKKHAQRLARLGINLVRLHHHDSARWVRPSLIKEGETTQQIDEKALDFYFWWIKCLRDEGIYLWIDLQTLRPWRKGDEISGWDTDMIADTKRGMSISKGFIYLNERMQELTKKFNEALLTRVNPFTDLALKDDPAVMGILITNENDVTHHFGNTFLGDKGHPYHNALFEKEVAAFSKQHGISTRKLGKTWEAGASKLFLNDLEARFNKMMIAHLRSIGVKAPIAMTNLWGPNPLFSLPALTTGDVIDVHGYADPDPLRKNPHYTANFIHWIARGQVSGMPMTVTEYNTNEKTASRNGNIIAPYMAAIGALQGWDAMMLYGYSQDGFRGKHLSPWSSYLNSAMMGLIPASALLYRQRHVSPAKKTTVLRPEDDTLFSKKLSPKESVALRTIPEQHRQQIAMPTSNSLDWLKPSMVRDDAIVIDDLEMDFLENDKGIIRSDNGEITRDWMRRILIIDTPMTQGAIGETGGEKIVLSDVMLEITTVESTVILTALDGKQLSQSEKILISTAARVRKGRGKQDFHVLSERVTGKVALKSLHQSMHLLPLLRDGGRGEPITLRYSAGEGYQFILPTDEKSHWFLIEKAIK